MEPDGCCPRIAKEFCLPGGAVTRYILLTFGLLGFAGYEMSGGAEFQPRPRPETVAEVAPPPPVTVNVPTTAATLVATRAMERRAAREARSDTPVIRAGLSNGLAGVPSGDAAIASLKAIAESASFESPEAPEAQATPAAEAQVLPAVVEAPVVTSPDLVRPVMASNADVRAISATRVNMRSGPGIDTEVMARLTRGQQVQVLEDNGQGWLRLRTLPGDQVGWIAERLVGPSVN
ncbi:MAG: SH3 domain-containing protein [Pseudooceanicola sp.]|nr:SH3 domain-containing protein [Pseudooceanicola sp.]